MIEQLLKAVEEKSKAHALSVRASTPRRDRLAHAKEATRTAEQAVALAYEAFHDAVEAVQQFHHGETK